MKCDGCFGASFDDCKRCKKMTGKEYQKKSYVDYELLVRKSTDRIDMEQENESL